MNELMKYKTDEAFAHFQRIYVYGFTKKNHKKEDVDLLINSDYEYIQVRKFFVIRFDKLKDSNQKVCDFLLTSSGEEGTNSGLKTNWSNKFGLDVHDITIKVKEEFPLNERDFRLILNTITPRLLRFYNND